MPIITLRDGQPLYTRVIGRGQPVLVLSGLGMESRQWLPFFAPFLHRFKFYIPDYRGFGGSNKTPFATENDVFHNHMQDIEDVVVHFQLNDFLLMGYSLGATTAMHWMQHGNFAQQSIRRYLQIDQTPCIHNKADWAYGLLGDQQALFMHSLQQLLTILDRNSHIDQITDFPVADKQQIIRIWGNTLASMLGKSISPTILKLAPYNAFLFKSLVPFGSNYYMQVYLKSYLEQRYDYRQAIAKQALPMTFFVGAQSMLYAAEGQRLIANSTQQPQVIEFEQSGHTPLFNEPVKFVRELGRFLKG